MRTGCPGTTVPFASGTGSCFIIALPGPLLRLVGKFEREVILLLVDDVSGQA